MNILSSLIFIDHQIAVGVINLRSDFMDHFFFLITRLGSWPIITGLFIITACLFWLYKRKQLILPFLIVIAGAGIMTIIIKALVDRSRPGSNLALYIEKLSSFPSAHAALSLAFFSFLIYCFWRFNLSLKTKIISSVILGLTVLLVGFSRIYLGVHFTSDIIAGYLIGLMWVLIGMYISRKDF